MMKTQRWQYFLICMAFLYLASNAFAGAWLPTKMEMDGDANGTIDSIVYYLYDTEGRMTALKSDDNADGKMDAIIYNTYDKDGYTVISEQDLDADGDIDSVIFSSQSADGKTSITEYDDNADGTIDSNNYASSDGGCPVMTNNIYAGAGAYDGKGTLTDIIYDTYDANCNIVKKEEDEDVDGQIDEITYTTYDEKCRPIIDKVDSNNDGEFENVSQFSYDDKGLILRSEVDLIMESYGISVTGKDVMTFENTYDGNGNAVKIASHLHATRTILGATTETDSYTITYNTYEYFERVEKVDGCGNKGCCGNADGADDGTDDGDGAATRIDGGYALTSELWSKAVLDVPGAPVTLVWKQVGADITPSGDQVISGYFYADPDDFAYGSQYNPEVFVKVYIATNGWCNIAYNHVTVDGVTVYSAHNYAGSPAQTGIAVLTNRLVEHQYTGVAIDIALKNSGSEAATRQDGGYDLTSELWAMASLQPTTGPIGLIWKTVGTDTTPTGDRVVSGYFYASPDDFAYGSQYNPEVFVKIYIAANGWANIAFNHVTVDPVALSSAHHYSGTANQSGTATLSGRLVEHQYDGVGLQ